MNENYMRQQVIADRIEEIAEVCERENRTTTEDEQREIETLKNEINNLKSQREMNENVVAQKSFSAEIRETFLRGEKYQRDITKTDNLPDPAYQGVKVQDVVDPIYEGLILDKVGLPFETGLQGSFVWPTYEAAQASIVGEGVALADSAIEFNQLVATPERMGIAVPVSREAINRSEGVVESVVRKVIPNALSALMNKVMFSTTKVGGDNSNLVGPFVGKTAEALGTDLGSALAAMKAKVLENTDGHAIAWVMSKATEALLETTPVNSKGVYRPIVEPGSHMLYGFPIFTTQYIGEKTVGIGDWAYQPTGLFGQLDLIVDPYTPAKNGAIDFVCNVDFATKCLRKDAFVIGTFA